jgi:hypothetical protein
MKISTQGKPGEFSAILENREKPQPVFITCLNITPLTLGIQVPVVTICMVSVGLYHAIELYVMIEMVYSEPCNQLLLTTSVYQIPKNNYQITRLDWVFNFI